ncbi:MAG: CDP-alcohol phosphatidyltransferase family protein [Saprospiraceae bacterium]|nr:CDP-alcohol phosphatidyltransferase family protein [Saprospiraceae bacterium]
MFSLPNLLTLINLSSGLVGTYAVFSGQPKTGAICILIGLIADLFDGYLARLLKKEGPFGVQLDSFADMVTFGILPGMFVLLQLQKTLPAELGFLAFLGFMIPVFSALRLARFNINTDLTPSDFQGVPTPVVGVFFGGIMLATPHILSDNPWILLAFSSFWSFMMISEFSIIKFIPTTLWFRKHWPLWLLYLCAAFFLYQSPGLIFSAWMLFYVLYSFYFFLLNKNKLRQ